MNLQTDLIALDDVTLTSEHVQLADLQAEHSHIQWVQALQMLGWQYGAQFDPVNQTHPHLQPFQALPQGVREEKRQVFLENLKVALALGYRLENPRDNAVRVPTHPNSSRTIATSTAASDDKLTSLIRLRRDILKGQQAAPEPYCVLGDILLQMGEPLIAYDVLLEGLQQWPNHLRLQQLVALALARSGATLSANQLLQKLVTNGQDDEQTLGLLARTHKDLSGLAKDPQVRERQLRLAADRYLQAYQQSHSLWTGINAATMATLLSQPDQARSLASAVRQQGMELLAEAGKDPYWVLATLGEAELILGNWEAAETYYAQAAVVGQGRFGDLCSSYRNGMLLMQHFGENSDPLKHWLQIPRVVVFCGHRIDAPDRSAPRFPAYLEGYVYAAIRERLRQLRGHVGFASAASGSDILFLEAIRDLGGEFTVVLPYPQADFVQDSVKTESEGNWVNRFEQAIAHAREVVIASDCKPRNDELTYEYSNRMLHGLAQIRANQLQTELVPLTVWNRQPGDGLGGTASTVAHWQRWSSQVEVIDLEGLLQSARPSLQLSSAQVEPEISSPISPSETAQVSPREIRALLFADVVHYTQLSEDQIVVFMQHFLKAIADLSAQPSHAPLMQNTWGDALYCVFAKVQEAGLFALKLCDAMQTIDWVKNDLPSDMNLRISLHAGPVIRNINPLTGQINYIGTHVNYAARIEPITPPGKVYASQAFAAIAASEGVSEFTCDYVGQMPWAKQYGTFPTYHVHLTA